MKPFQTVLVAILTLSVSACGKSGESAEETSVANLNDGIVNPVADNLVISPTSVNATGGQVTQFSATGGTGLYNFSVQSGAGSINPLSGAFTSPTTSSTTVVKVEDSGGNIQYAYVYTTAASNPSTGGGLQNYNDSVAVANAGVLIEAQTPLTISPTSINLNAGATQLFTTTGGAAGAKTFSVVSGGGSFSGRSAGRYTAPSSGGLISQVCVTDTAGASACATVTTNITKNAMHRFRYGSNTMHFMTTNKSEGLNAGMTYEGVGFYLYGEPSAGKAAIFRCYDRFTSAHFISNGAYCNGKESEGIYGYAYTTATAGTVMLHQFYNNSNKDYLITTSYNEGLAAGYTWLGMWGYVPTSP